MKAKFRKKEDKGCSVCFTCYSKRVTLECQKCNKKYIYINNDCDFNACYCQMGNSAWREVENKENN